MILPSNDLRDKIARPLAQLCLPFYRRYPYRGPVSLFHLNMRCAYSPLDGFLYNRIPKAANSTIATFLALHSKFRSHIGPDRAKSRFLRPEKLGRRDVDRIANNETFCFVFVRDPFERILSAYLDKIVRREIQGRRHFPDIVANKDAIPDFLTFCNFLRDGGLFLDAHWAPQSALLLLPLERFDLIGRVETIEPDLALVAKRIWNRDPVADLSRVGFVSSAKDKVSQHYCNQSAAIIRALYAADFEAFSYDAHRI